MKTIELKTGESYVATSASPYPNFDYTCKLPGGGMQVLEFRGNLFTTEDSNIATALQEEVDAPGCVWLTKGEVLKTAELDPLFKLREQIRKEELEKIAKAAVTETSSENSGKGLVTAAAATRKLTEAEQAIAKAQAAKDAAK